MTRGRRRVAVAVVLALAILSTAAVLGFGNDQEAARSQWADPPQAQSPRPAKREVLVVDNRVTRGPRMTEDPLPLRLTTKPWTYCLRRGCAIQGNERRSGQTYDAAICQTRGDKTTNGDLGNDLDNDNPLLHSSDRYYRVQLVDDTYGYVSEVWVRPSDRGGLGLPLC